MTASEIKKRKKNKKGKKMLKRFFISLAIFLAIVVGGSFLLISWLTSGLTIDDITDDKDELGIGDDVPEATGITNIALFGIDSRDDADSRSDSIIILTIDHNTNKIKLTSILRDSYVLIDGSYDKITHAYYYGGAVLAIKTLNENFNLDITDYVTVDFSQMADIIDAFGGVTVDISYDEMVAANGNITELAYEMGYSYGELITEYGEDVWLNGEQAVGFARIRSVGNGDFDRTDRQQEVLEDLFTTALTIDYSEYVDIIQTIAPLTTTSLSFDEILSEALVLLDSPQLQKYTVPEDEYYYSIYYDGISYVGWEEEETLAYLKYFIYYDVDPDYAYFDIEKNYSQAR